MLAWLPGLPWLFSYLMYYLFVNNLRCGRPTSTTQHSYIHLATSHLSTDEDLQQKQYSRYKHAMLPVPHHTVSHRVQFIHIYDGLDTCDTCTFDWDKIISASTQHINLDYLYIHTRLSYQRRSHVGKVRSYKFLLFMAVFLENSVLSEATCDRMLFNNIFFIIIDSFTGSAYSPMLMSCGWNRYLRNHSVMRNRKAVSAKASVYQC